MDRMHDSTCMMSSVLTLVVFRLIVEIYIISYGNDIVFEIWVDGLLYKIVHACS